MHEPRTTNHALSGPIRLPRSGVKPKQLVVLLHGWGADGPNLIDLADMFAPALPDAQFIAPNAPFVCEVNPYGYQWFSLMDRQPQHMLAGVRKAADILNAFLDEQLALLTTPPPSGGRLGGGHYSSAQPVSPHPNPLPEGEGVKIALVGFSQGTMTGLHVALRRMPAIAALVGFSGALLAPELLAKEIVARPPTCLIHGNMDDVVPYASLAQAQTALTQHGVELQAHTRPMLGHSIDMEGMRIAAEFLKSRLS